MVNTNRTDNVKNNYNFDSEYYSYKDVLIKKGEYNLFCPHCYGNMEKAPDSHCPKGQPINQRPYICSKCGHRSAHITNLREVFDTLNKQSNL